MKAQKMIYLEIELIDKLNKINASELISKLLDDYFKEDKLEDIKEEINNVGDKIKELQEKEAKIKEGEQQQAKIDSIIINDKLKEWFIKKQERPTILELDQYLIAHQIQRSMNMSDYLLVWDDIHAQC